MMKYTNILLSSDTQEVSNFDWYFIYNGHVGFLMPLLIFCIDIMHSPIYWSSIGSSRYGLCASNHVLYLHSCCILVLTHDRDLFCMGRCLWCYLSITGRKTWTPHDTLVWTKECWGSKWEQKHFRCYKCSVKITTSCSGFSSKLYLPPSSTPHSGT